MNEIQHTGENLTPKEIYDLKRKHFIEKTLEFFQFLLTDLNYEDPVYKFFQQENGVITSDSFYYKNSIINRVIAIKNQYHPNDYGFSIEIGLLNNYTEKNVGKLLFYKLKEEQDTEQSYIKELAVKLRNEYLPQINGSTF